MQSIFVGQDDHGLKVFEGCRVSTRPFVIGVTDSIAHRIIRFVHSCKELQVFVTIPDVLVLSLMPVLDLVEADLAEHSNKLVNVTSKVEV